MRSGFSVTKNQLMESKRFVDEYEHSLKSPSQRFDSTRFNVLKATGREVLQDSLKAAGPLGRNGLNRFDVTPAVSEQYNVREFYMKELKEKKGTTNFTDGGLFIVKGLHNFSNLPAGDTRLIRTTTAAKEQYLPPTQRAAVPPKFSHLQSVEKVGSDLGLGPANVMSQVASLGPEEEEERELLRLHRGRYYRDMIEKVQPPDRLFKLEVTLRDKLQQYAGGASGFAFKNTFRFFDRGASGAIDLEGFRKALVAVGFELSEKEYVALFARYDTKRQGFLDYSEFSARVLAPDTGVSKSEARKMGATLNSAAAFYRASGSFAGLRKRPSSSMTQLGAWSQQMSDDEFLVNQQLRSIFCNLDKNESGTIEYGDFWRMLRMIGASEVSPLEARAIFEHIDENKSQGICFEDFADFCRSEVPS